MFLLSPEADMRPGRFAGSIFFWEKQVLPANAGGDLNHREGFRHHSFGVQMRSWTSPSFFLAAYRSSIRSFTNTPIRYPAPSSAARPISKTESPSAPLNLDSSLS